MLEIRAASVETSLETCGVGEQVAQCDWFTVVFLDRDIGVGGDVGVEASLPCSTSCIAAMEVGIFEIDPQRNTVVSGSTGT